ncbi:hypothetical protein PAMP_023275 [Pampus punctatissimus]
MIGSQPREKFAFEFGMQRETRRNDREQTENSPDITPQISRLMPHRPPEAQVNPPCSTFTDRSVQVVLLTGHSMRTLCKSTNTYAAKRQEMGKMFIWTDIEVVELYKLLGLLLFSWWGCLTTGD